MYRLLSTIVLLLVTGGCTPDTAVSVQTPSSERTDEFHWYPYSVGVIDRHYEGGLGHHGVIAGEGSYLTVRDGESYPGTTGGWYYQVGLQLPMNLKSGDVFELLPASDDKHFERVGDFYTVGFLKPNEFVAFRYANPTGAFMPCQDQNSFAKVRIDHVDRDRIIFHLSLHADIPVKSGHNIGDVTIDRSFDLARSVVPGG